MVKQTSKELEKLDKLKTAEKDITKRIMQQEKSLKALKAKK